MSLRTAATTALVTAAGALLAAGTATSAQAAQTPVPQTPTTPAAFFGEEVTPAEGAAATWSLTRFLLGSGD
ncbi:hypothetical protein LUW75_00775 [Streptomyces sp. MRC013]|uniref:hypothetical protein n=1 Tax=Streptomyces sp. MRC013 TaxID=2898276 RepID=UPI002026F85B|nr:hypothetical protein [Streptomyces sp. MRC013]URM88794.1 hypothetical protein LUW75_00775 [Streptomyces sp. MRC013]